MMEKKFKGYDLGKLIETIDDWLLVNNAAFYGSKPMIKREVTDENGQTRYEITVAYVTTHGSI